MNNSFYEPEVHLSIWFYLQSMICSFFLFWVKEEKRITLVRFVHYSANGNIHHFILLFFSTIFFSSCEKVIDVNLNEGARKYVIEGTVSNLPNSPAEVRLSQTKSFSDDNTFKGISGAVITIQVNGGSYTLTESTTGIYRSTAFTGMPGKTYKLSVMIGGKTFTATSTMPAQLVTLDTLTVDGFAFGGSTTKIIHPSYLDPAGIGNSYRFIQYANGVQVKKVFVQNDDLSDGLRITRPLVNENGDLKSGDIVKVEMLHIDAAVYKYWYSLDQAASGSNQSASPGNPVSNINGDALGYFSAHSVSSKTIRVQ